MLYGTFARLQGSSRAGINGGLCELSVGREGYSPAVEGFLTGMGTCFLTFPFAPERLKLSIFM
jgi:hypothetical protein